MITAGIARSFLVEILMGLHQPTDTYAIALYSSAADLGPLTEAYTTDAEVIGAPGYQAGGQVLTGFEVQDLDGVAVLNFDDPTWSRASIAARGALIYNRTRENRAVVVLDFGQNIVSTNGDFMVTLPEDALVAIGGE